MQVTSNINASKMQPKYTAIVYVIDSSSSLFINITYIVVVYLGAISVSFSSQLAGAIDWFIYCLKIFEFR